MQQRLSLTEFLPEQLDLLPCYDGGTGRQIDPPNSLQLEARQLVSSLGFAPDLRGAVQ